MPRVSIKSKAELAGQMMLKYKLIQITIGEITFTASGMTHPVENDLNIPDSEENPFLKNLADPTVEYFEAPDK